MTIKSGRRTRGQCMRPRTIAWFELLSLAGVALSLAFTVMIWEETTRALGLVVLSVVLAVFLSLFIMLILLVSRRRSRIAKWVMVAFAALACFGLVDTLKQGIHSFLTAVDVMMML